MAQQLRMQQQPVLQQQQGTRGAIQGGNVSQSTGTQTMLEPSSVAQTATLLPPMQDTAPQADKLTPKDVSSLAKLDENKKQHPSTTAAGLYGRLKQANFYATAYNQHGLTSPKSKTEITEGQSRPSESPPSPSRVPPVILGDQPIRKDVPPPSAPNPDY